MTTDLLTLEQIETMVLERVRELREDALRVRRDLGLDEEGGEGATEVEVSGQQVETASGGVISAEDYVAAVPQETVGFSSSTSFGRIFNDAKQRLLTLGAEDVNAFTRQALEEAIEIIREIEALLGQIVLEAGKIRLASTAGLLDPPLPSDVRALRDQTEELRKQSSKAVGDMAAARSRRTAAKRHLQNDFQVTESVIDEDLRGVRERFLEPLSENPQFDRQDPTDIGQSYVTADLGNLENESTRVGRVDQKLAETTADISSGVLDNVGHLALCMTLKMLDGQEDDRRRAQALFNRLKSLVESLVESISPVFTRILQDGVQEFAAQSLESAANLLQEKVDSFDTWLALEPPELPLVVSLVRALGDDVPETPIIESLAGYCDLNLSSFCETQGLLEIAKAIDANIVKIKPRVPALGRIRLLALAPEAEDYRPVELQPDRETDLIYSSLSGLELRARPPRADVFSEFQTPSPPVSGTLTSDIEAEAETLEVSGLTAAPATLGSVTLNPGPLQTVLRYSAHESGTFTLIDLPTGPFLAGTPVQVTGEHRENFTAAFAPSPNIQGGPGTLTLAGDGENRESVDYSSSSFDESTGEHVFQLESPGPLEDHGLQVSGRPSPVNRTLLFKDQGNLLTPADRFNVSGDEVTHITDGSFDFSSQITIGDYSGAGEYRLSINGLAGVEIDSMVAGKLTLTEPFYAGAQTSVTLSRVRRHVDAGETRVRARLTSRQKYDLRIESLGIGSTQSVEGRVIVDTGSDAAVRVAGETSSVTGVSDDVQQLTTDWPVIKGDEAGYQIDIQSGASSFRAQITAVGTRTLTYQVPAISGLITVTGTTVTGDASTRFTNELAPGDWLRVGGQGLAKIDTITDNASLELETAPGNATDVAGYLVAPEGSVIRTFAVFRRPSEILDFTAITNVDDEVYEFTTTATTRAHGLQDVVIRPTVRVVAQSLQEFLDHFSQPPENVRPRFDGSTIPTGSEIVRAELETPEARDIVHGFVMAADELLTDNQTPSVNFVTEVDTGVYEFHLSSPLVFKIDDGQVVEVETTDIVDELADIFPDDWYVALDTFFQSLATVIDRAQKKMCRILSGRIMSLETEMDRLTSETVVAQATLASIRLTLQVLAPGLTASDVIGEVLETFRGTAMTAAYDALKAGDLAKIASMTVNTASKEGQAIEALRILRPEVVHLGTYSLVTDMEETLRADEYDRKLRGDMERDYKDMADDASNRKLLFSSILEDEAETVT